MSVHCDFIEQTQSEDKKPDMIVRLPGERIIIVDAKVPDLDFIAALETGDLERRTQSLKAHAARLKETIKELAERDYPSEFQNSLDCVVLFLPAESLFSAALEGDRELIIWAASKRIMLATPASLIGLLRAVSFSWQQFTQTENVRTIAEAAQELYDRVTKFTEHFEKIGAGLSKANEAFDEAVGSYERRVRPSGELLLKLGLKTDGKSMAEIKQVKNALRLPNAVV
jgi:DNA recombination protein RmuC